MVVGMEKDARCAANTGVPAGVEGDDGAPNEYTDDAEDCRSFSGEDKDSSNVVKLSIMMDAESTWSFSSCSCRSRAEWKECIEPFLDCRCSRILP